MALVSSNWPPYKPIRPLSPPCTSCSSPADLAALQCADQLSCAPSAQLTAQCTDQCVVIACSDPEHTDIVCAQTGPHTQCDFVCDEAVDCVGCHGFDQFLQCCDEYRPYGAEAARQAPVAAGAAPPSSAWETAFEEWCAACAEMVNTQTGLKGAENSGDGSGHASVHQHGPPQSASGQTVDSFSPRSHHPSTPAPTDCTCMWAGCGATFASLSELVGHVNLDHLATSSSPPSSGSSNDKPSNNGSQDVAPISCLWDNCGSSYYSASNSFELLAHHLLNDHLSADPLPHFHQHHQPGNHREHEHSHSHQHQHQHSQHIPRVRTYEEQIRSFQQRQHQIALTHQHAPQTNDECCQPRSHEQELEHARFPLVRTYMEQLQTVLDNNAKSNAHPTESPLTRPALPPESDHDVEMEVNEPLSQITAPNNHSCGGAHECRWKGCGLSFHSCDALTMHINDVHIGGGKAHYECFWDQCTRNGAQGFQSKQKISRHVQSHTGHRPFQCSICQQNFSEAATLQQHIRRHTQERPYVCDHPGCGKSFAITGALTIHKRTHNGDKPFKCSYCDRGFAESSNLSKHLRTHTGARPYVCSEPGCSKAFARPDQLNRHKGVHKKQTRGIGGSTQD